VDGRLVTPKGRRWAIQQRPQARASKLGGSVLTAVAGLVIVAIVAKDTPAPARRSGAAGSTHVGVDVDATDIDVSGL
jgi:hypothetical protein